MKYALGVLLFVGIGALSATLNKYKIITSHVYWEMFGAAEFAVYFLLYQYYFK